MEEDNIQYFNDEWNNGKWIEDPLMFPECSPESLEVNRNFMKNFHQLSCQCSLPRPNSFTGNCIICNKIIKPIIDKDADKRTR